MIYFLQTQQQIAVQGQQVAQTAEGQTIVYQPVNADGTILQQGKCAHSFLSTFGEASFSSLEQMMLQKFRGDLCMTHF